MTSRTHALFIMAGAAAMALVLAACSGSAPATPPGAEAMKTDSMKADPMQSDPMKGDAMKSDAMKPDAMSPAPMSPAPMSPAPMSPAMAPDPMMSKSPGN